MKKIFFFTITLTCFACTDAEAQTAENPTAQPVSSGRGDVVLPGTSAAATVASDSVTQVRSGKLDVAPGAASGNTSTEPEGQPADAVRKPD